MKKRGIKERCNMYPDDVEYQVESMRWNYDMVSWWWLIMQIKISMDGTAAQMASIMCKKDE